MAKIHFPTENQKLFYASLNNDIQRRIEHKNLLAKAKKLLWFKLAFYLCLYSSVYLLMLIFPFKNPIGFIFSYVAFGLAGILLAFNASHDAAHGTFSNKKWINIIIFRLTFNINGVNSYLWKKRHIASHHIFPNVDGCDADIDENKLLRISPTHKLRSYHRYQHIYSTFLYMFYTLHWIFYKDFLYLSVKELSNLKNIRHPKIEIFRFFLWKFNYFIVYIIIPILFIQNIKLVLFSFMIMHLVISIFFVWTLIISHLTLETQFPVQNKEGKLPMDYYTHQLATSMDYRPQNFLMNWFLGGFNAHAAHHLFPKWPHTMNRSITKSIQRTAKKFNLPYNSMSFVGALFSHYRFLKLMGKGLSAR
jgi:linoleoyl-CoA desaturase